MGRALTFAVFFCALAGQACGQEEDEEEAKPVLLLYKKMDPMTDFAVGQPINITHTVFNKGLGNAYSVMVNDDFWKPDKFSIIGGTNNFTLDFLNAGDQYTSYLTVVPIKKGYARVRAARMAYIDGVEGENSIMAYSNTLPEMKIAEAKSAGLVTVGLMLGRVVTLNQVQTEAGWKNVGLGVGAIALLQLFFVGKNLLIKRRQMRAEVEVKKW